MRVGKFTVLSMALLVGLIATSNVEDINTQEIYEMFADMDNVPGEPANQSFDQVMSFVIK